MRFYPALWQQFENFRSLSDHSRAATWRPNRLIDTVSGNRPVIESGGAFHMAKSHLELVAGGLNGIAAARCRAEGPYGFALPNARMHQPKGGFEGQVTDIMLHAHRRF
jgi:hypothetical protein